MLGRTGPDATRCDAAAPQQSRVPSAHAALSQHAPALLQAGSGGRWGTATWLSAPCCPSSRPSRTSPSACGSTPTHSLRRAAPPWRPCAAAAWRWRTRACRSRRWWRVRWGGAWWEAWLAARGRCQGYQQHAWGRAQVPAGGAYDGSGRSGALLPGRFLAPTCSSSLGLSLLPGVSVGLLTDSSWGGEARTLPAAPVGLQQAVSPVGRYELLTDLQVCVKVGLLQPTNWGAVCDRPSVWLRSLLQGRILPCPVCPQPATPLPHFFPAGH